MDGRDPPIIQQNVQIICCCNKKICPCSSLILLTLIQTQYEDSDLGQLDQLVSRGNLMMKDERERERLRVEN